MRSQPRWSNLQRLRPRLVSLRTAPAKSFRVCCVPVCASWSGPWEETDMTCTLPRAKRISFTGVKSVEPKILAAHGGQTRRLRRHAIHELYRNVSIQKELFQLDQVFLTVPFSCGVLSNWNHVEPIHVLRGAFVPSKCFESSRLNHVTFHLFLPLPLCALFSPTLLSSLLALSSLFSSLRRHFLLRLFHIVLPPLSPHVAGLFCLF